MDKHNGINVGDWVRFYKDSRLIIAVVEYLAEEVGGRAVLLTDQGRVSPELVAEVRPQPPEV